MSCLTQFLLQVWSRSERIAQVESQSEGSNGQEEPDHVAAYKRIEVIEKISIFAFKPVSLSKDILDLDTSAVLQDSYEAS
jgi:hypothetical protein